MSDEITKETAPVASEATNADPSPSLPRWGYVDDASASRESSQYLGVMVAGVDGEIEVPKEFIHPASQLQRYGDRGRLIALTGYLLKAGSRCHPYVEVPAK